MAGRRETDPLVGQEQGALVALALEGGAARAQLLGHGQLAGYPRVELEEDALVAELDEAALVEHDPAVGIVRIDWSAGRGTARD